jgi:uncharacterized membrane protein
MPLKWEDFTDKAPASTGAFSFDAGNGPARRLELWPHRSLAPKGFVWFIGITFTMFLIPLTALLGTSALWGMLPFLMGALALIWYSLHRSTRDGRVHEVLTIWNDRVELTRQNPRDPDQQWDANPHWAEVKIRPEGGPVENYITLRGNNRTVEIGAFLSPEERADLYGSLCRWIG